VIRLRTGWGDVESLDRVGRFSAAARIVMDEMED
jgi:hypothetical protein